MSKDIYGVFMIHPDDATKPGWQETLPDKTGEPVRYFETIAGAKQAMVDCSKGDWTLSAKFGPAQECLSMGSVGIVYRVAVSDALIEYAHQQRQQTANADYLFSLPLPQDAIIDVTAIVPKDALNKEHVVELADVTKILNTRKEGMLQLHELFKKSKPHQMQTLYLGDDATREALSFLYGREGLMVNPAKMPDYAQLHAVLSNILTIPETNIAYALEVIRFRDVFDAMMSENTQTNPKVRALQATQAVLNEIAHVADTQGDFRVRSKLFSLQNQVQKELCNTSM